MKLKPGRFLPLLLLLCAAPPLRAQQPDSARAHASPGQPPAWRTALPERPTVATHAYTVAPGVFELEAGVQATRPAGGSETDLPLVLKFGIAPALQLELLETWSRSAGTLDPRTPPVSGAATGLGDLALAPKLCVLRHAPLLADFSVEPSLKLPTGTAGVTGTGTTDVGLLLISSRSFGPVELDLNAGMTWRSGDGTVAPTRATFLTQSWGIDFGRGRGWVVELFDYPGTSGPAGSPPQVGLLTGPTLALRPWLVLDAGAIANVHGFPANSAYAGLTWNMGRLRGWPGAR